MEEFTNDIEIIHCKPDLIENTIGRVNSIVTNILLGTPRATIENPSEELAETIREKLKDVKTKGKIEMHLGHSPVFREMKRLFNSDRRTNLFARIGIGLPYTVIGSLFLGKFNRADHYNPFTETVHSYHSHLAPALHEAGHALDFDNSNTPSLKSLLRLIPPIQIKQEWQASRNAMEMMDKDERAKASKILEPALASYVGAWGGALLQKFTGIPIATMTALGTILAGHIHARTSERNIFFNGESVKGSQIAPAFKPAIA